MKVFTREKAFIPDDVGEDQITSETGMVAAGIKIIRINIYNITRPLLASESASLMIDFTKKMSLSSDEARRMSWWKIIQVNTQMVTRSCVLEELDDSMRTLQWMNFTRHVVVTSYAVTLRIDCLL
jgi:hypothetical protein